MSRSGRQTSGQPMMTDGDYMDWSLALAARGRGRTSPNPMVGAVVVSPGGVVVGFGHHAAAGRAHAEVRALDAAAAAARDATLYCNLEPCCTTGRTGPCTDRILRAGIRRVVVGVEDANPRVAGRGIRVLRERGLQVDVGVRRAAAARLNAPFFTWVRHRRPFVVVKIATSLDGRIAARAGQRTPLTGEAATRRVHAQRAEVDAVGVGVGTVRVDDPRLTARLVSRTRPLVRVVFDRRLETPPAARLFSTLDAGPVIIMTSGDAVRAAPEAAGALEAVGAEVDCVDGPGWLRQALDRLAQREIVSLLLEGGSRLHAAAWAEGLVDRVHVYVAPTWLGPAGVPWLAGLPPVVASLRGLRAEPCGQDVFIEGDVHRID